MGEDVRRIAGPKFSGAILLRFAGERLTVSLGWADGDARVENRPDTRFNTASLTKLFTSVAICRLAEAGAFQVEDSIDTILPDTHLALAGEIRIEHLLTHTAGFPEEVPGDEWPNPGTGWLDLADGSREFLPGAGWGYSNVGYAVLGAIIERVTGRTYFEAIDDLVFEPAGMADSGFDDLTSVRPAHAIGYLVAPSSGRRAVDNRSSGLHRGAPYGYAYSTIVDLERLIDLIVDHSIVSANTADRILFGTVATTQPHRSAGYGMFAESSESMTVSTTAGAGPGISAWLDVVAERAYLAVILSNLPKPAAHDVGQALRQAYLRP